VATACVRSLKLPPTFSFGCRRSSQTDRAPGDEGDFSGPSMRIVSAATRVGLAEGCCEAHLRARLRGRAGSVFFFLTVRTLKGEEAALSLPGTIIFPRTFPPAGAADSSAPRFVCIATRTLQPEERKNRMPGWG